jgi:hypothetical protein
MTEADKLRTALMAVVAERMAASSEAAQHTHIECHCADHVHRTDNFEQGCFCPGCASAEAVARGLASGDTEPDGDGPDDNPQWCEKCGRLITAEITSDGALEELVHWQGDLPSARLDRPERWREFMLCVAAISEEHLPRVAALIDGDEGSAEPWSGPPGFTPARAREQAALAGEER